MTLRLASICLLPLVAWTADAAPGPVAKPSTPTFAARLAGELAKRPGNVIASPASIEIALAMTREGARGKTAAELDAVLGDAARADVEHMLSSFEPSASARATGPELAVANRLFSDDRSPLEPAFIEVTRDRYRAPVEQLDFRTQSAAAREHINTWVAQQTHDKIKDLLAKPDIDASTRMVLVNAIYLKAQWATPFEASATAPAAFAIEGAASHPVRTMHAIAGATWGAHAGARLIDLPYAAGGDLQLAMLVVVPDGKNLSDVGATYAREGIAPFLAALDGVGAAAVALPAFETSTTFDLTATLQTLGIRRAFTNAAEFAGVSSVATRISKVVHKAWIKVDEHGTEAAAATAVVMAKGANPTSAHPFKVDRSFLFFVHDQKGNVLFGGRIIDPSAS